MKAALIVVLLAFAAIGASANTAARNAATCVAGRDKLEKDASYQKYVTANAGCYNPAKASSHDCKTNLDDLKAACKRVEGWVCALTFEYSNSSRPADTRFTKQVTYVCTPSRCPEPDAYAQTVAVQAAGYKGAYVWSSCDANNQMMSPNQMGGGGDLVFQLIFWGCTLAFAASEKSRRAPRTATYWPAAAGAEKMRTTLFECCGCSRVCWSSFCCCTVMTSMNRAELDKRQWAWYDCCCMSNACCCVAWHNRQAIRTRLNTREDWCSDCFSLLFCPACFIGQNTLELEKGLPDAPVSGGATMDAPSGASAVQMVPTAVAMGAPLPGQGYPPATSGAYTTPAGSAPQAYPTAAYGGYPPTATSGAQAPTV